MNETFSVTSALHSRRTIFLLGSLSAFGALSIDMYLPSLPTLQQHFQVHQLSIQLTLAAFFLGFSAGQAILGPISDRFGRRIPLLVALTLYVGASIACAVAPSALWLAIFRLLQGIGACSGPVIGRALVRDLFPPQDATHIFSRMILVMGVAPIFAPPDWWLSSRLFWLASYFCRARLTGCNEPGGKCVAATCRSLWRS